jgi:pyruvate ferredoxin oxidoreductase alpha subunit
MRLRDSKEVVLETWKEFSKSFGRNYAPVERYRCDDTKVMLVTMGSFSETAMTAIDVMREKGQDIGLLRLRLWRPFPFEEFREAVKGAEVLIVLDRALSYGGPAGPVCSEIRSALYNEELRPKVVSFIGGLGGRDITPAGFEDIVQQGIEIAEKGSKEEYQMYGVRE